MLKDADTGQAVVTEMRAGTGRAYYVGTHESWRWRGKAGEAEHDRFWRQLVRHAAEEPYAARAGRLALDLDRVAVAPGEPVKVRVRVYPDDPSSAEETSGSGQPRPAPAPVPAETLRVAVYDAAAGSGSPPVRITSLTEAGDGGAGRLRGTLPDLPAGRYAVRLASTAPGGVPAAGWPEVSLRVDPPTEDEMRHLAGDPDRLRRMAESTWRPAVAAPPARHRTGLLAAAEDDRPRVVEWRLWDSPWLFAFVVACLGAEWALRNGLVWRSREVLSAESSFSPDGAAEA
jgi:hypothetical protein